METRKTMPVSPALSPKTQKVLQSIVAAGAVILLFGIVRMPERIWPSFLAATMFALTLALSGLVFIAIQYVANARWSTAFRRVPEALAASIPWTAGLVALILIFGGVPTLYEWSHATDDPLLLAKAAWLNSPFFVLRLAIYFAVWSFLGHKIVGHSRAQDLDGDPSHGVKNKALSALFLVLFAATFSGACFDLVMSIEAHWFSTIFALYVFSGLFVAGLACITLLTIWLSDRGSLPGVNTDHIQDMATLIFSFACFWAYLWFSQYMLIWYSNIPEETSYYMHRHDGLWASVSLFNLVIGFLLPFVMLMARKTKRSRKVVAWVCAIMLFGHWLDLSLMIQPVFSPELPHFGLLEIGPFALVVAGGMLVVSKNLGAANIQPERDPTLAVSLAHHL